LLIVTCLGQLYFPYFVPLLFFVSLAGFSSTFRFFDDFVGGGDIEASVP
jgi:hypothetical protein